jgi:transposase
MSNHTPEPWINCGTQKEDVRDADGFGICKARTNDARRIVACVNACKGLTTESLEAGNYPVDCSPIINRIDAIEVQRDELLAALKEAKEVIHTWHGKEAWEIHNEHSPEMQRINSAIAKAEA